MNPIGEGLLAGFAGAVQGADTYITAEKDYNRKRSLIEYQHSKQLEIEELKRKWGQEDTKAEQDYAAGLLPGVQEREDFVREDEQAAKKERAEIAAAASGGRESKDEKNTTQLKTIANARIDTAEREVVRSLVAELGLPEDAIETTLSFEDQMKSLRSRSKGDPQLQERIRKMADAAADARDALLDEAGRETQDLSVYDRIIEKAFRDIGIATPPPEASAPEIGIDPNKMSELRSIYEG